MARRPVAIVAAVLLVLEAVGVALLNWILGIVVDRQSMSLAGINTHAMSVGAWIAGGVFGLYLLCCAFLMVRCAVRNRSPQGIPRIVLITCAVVHGLLAAFSVGLVGWAAFGLLVVEFALIVLVLMTYDAPATAGDAPPDRPGRTDQPGRTDEGPEPAGGASPA